MLLGLSAFLAARGASASSQESASGGPALETFEMADLVKERSESGRPYLSFLELPTLRCGLYVLPAQGEDKQTPHRTDEIYYTIAGRAKIRVEGEVKDVRPGSVIYVRAGAEHRFIDIEEELQLLVFFD